MYKILMMIQVIIMKILAKCKFGGETMIRQFAKFSLPPKLVVVWYFSCGIIQSRQVSCMNRVVIYSYQFIANSTSYLNAAGFSDGFFQFL